MERTRLFTLTLVRHGETLSNRNKIMQGQLDTQLSDVGHEQAKLVGARLKDEQFTHAFSSDLARAADTARHILEENAANSSCGLTLEPLLRERNFGWLEGKPHTEYKKALDDSGVSSHMFTPDGGETMDQLTQRARDFYRGLCKLMAESMIKPGDVNGSVSDSALSSSNVSLVENGGTISAATGNVTNGQNQPASGTSDLVIESSSTNHADTEPGSVVYIETQLLSEQPPVSAMQQSLNASQAVSTFALQGIEIEPQQGRNALTVDAGFETETASVLVVSHGMLLRELQRTVMESLKGKAPERDVSPNTGVTQLTMAVTFKYGKVKTSCLACHCMNSASHLGGSNDDLAKLAVFSGAL